MFIYLKLGKKNISISIILISKEPRNPWYTKKYQGNILISLMNSKYRAYPKIPNREPRSPRYTKGRQSVYYIPWWTSSTAPATQIPSREPRSLRYTKGR